jgi:hypothetical protein
VLGPIRPHPRWLELRLLALVAVALAVGSLSLEATVHSKLGLYDPEWLLIYVIAFFAAHAAQVLAGRRTDQILLPTIGLLGEILRQRFIPVPRFARDAAVALLQLVFAGVQRALDLVLIHDGFRKKPIRIIPESRSSGRSSRKVAPRPRRLDWPHWFSLHW